MPDKYFKQFPKINYNNNEIVDITKRVTLLDRVSRNPYVYYPFEINSNERADQISNSYYNDSFKSWLLYLTNKIIDPYYEWYLKETEFNEFVEKKYGSIFEAQQKIKYYRNNWEIADNISKSEFDALPATMKRYWDPNYGINYSIIDYKRKREDWYSSTNKIISFDTGNTNLTFKNDEIVDIYIRQSLIGRGQVVTYEDTFVYLQHLSGYFGPSVELPLDETSYIYATESFTNTVITEAFFVANNISEEELNYWKPISYYDYEFEKNEYNKSIRIIDKRLAPVAVQNLQTLLKE